MTTTYELVIVDTVHPGRPPLTMNEWRNCHWRTKATAKTRITYQIKQALQASPVPPIRRCKVTITQYAPDGRRRDVDGLSAFRKDVLDSLVKWGVFPDDNYKHIVDGGNEIEIDRDNPRLVIRLDVLNAT